MITLHFSIHINAPVAKVWDTMLEDATYRVWTAAFNPGSYFKGSWDEGSKILFLGPSPTGNGEGGMVSRIKENRRHEFVSIEHEGVIENGVEQTDNEKWADWKGAIESYTFAEKDGGTELRIDVDTAESEAKVMGEMWEKALAKLKELAEAAVVSKH